MLVFRLLFIMSSHSYTPYAFMPKKSDAPAIRVENTTVCGLLAKDIRGANRNLDFCRCGHCLQMPTARECVCCDDVKVGISMWAKNWMLLYGEANCCFSELERIKKIVSDDEELDTFILHDQILLQGLAAARGRRYIDKYISNDPNARYRYACYRKITMLVHKRLDLGTRIELPSCIVSLVRNTYPSSAGLYRGFIDSNIVE